MAFGAGTAFVIQGVVNILTNAAEKQLSDLEKQGQSTSKGLTAGFDNAAASVVRFAGPAVLGALSAVLVKVAKDAIDFGIAIGDAQKKFQQETGASIQEAERFADAIGNLRKVNDESTGELVNTLTAVRRQFGLLGDDAEAMTQQFLDFADATGGDAAAATKTIGQTLRAWGLEAKDTGQLMDVLTKASQETGVGAEELAGTLGRSSALFQSMGFSVEEATAVLGGLSKQGVDSAAALTGMRNTLEAAQGPTAKQTAAFKTLGLSVDDLGRPVGGAKGLFEDLLDRFSNGGLNADQMTAALDILGAKAGGDLVRGLSAAGDSVDGLRQKLLDAQGATAAGAEAEGQTLANRTTAMYRAYFEPAIQEMGKLFNDGAGKLLDFLEVALGGLRQFADTAGNVWVNIGDAFSQVTTGISDLWNDMIADLERTMAQWLQNFVASLDALPAVVKGRLGDIQGSAASTAASLNASADARTSGREGRTSGFDAVKEGVGRIFGGIGGEAEVDVQDVVVDRNSKPTGPLVGKGGAGGGEGPSKSDGELRLERDIKALERKIQLEQISKQEAVAALDVLIKRSQDLGATEDDIFKLQKERLSLTKAIQAEADKAAKEAEAAQKKADDEAKKLRDKSARESEAAAKKAAAEAERAAKEAATAAETKRKAELSAEIEIAKLKGQTHREALLQIQEQVREMRAAGVSEQQIDELVAAKKKALMDGEVKAEGDKLSRIEALRKGESLLGKGGSTMGTVMSLAEAFAQPEETKPDAEDAAATELAKGDLSTGQLSAALDGLKGVGASDVKTFLGQSVSFDPAARGGTGISTITNSNGGQRAPELSAELNININVTADGQTATQGGTLTLGANTGAKMMESLFTTPLTRF
ncbi:MAG: phage tail tape measure protein [Anaerolineae bacterium]